MTSRTDQFSGYIFMCNGRTKPECYTYRVFGLPTGRYDVVKKIEAHMKLFLFDFELKLLYGVYTASSPGRMGIEPYAFEGRFPAQVKFEILKECIPLPESVFKHAIKDNYLGGSKFRQELSNEQVTNLVSMFRPLPVQPFRAPERFNAPNDQYIGHHSRQFQSPYKRTRHDLEAFQSRRSVHASNPYVSADALPAYHPEHPTPFHQQKRGRYTAGQNDDPTRVAQFLSGGVHRTAAYWAALACANSLPVGSVPSRPASLDSNITGKASQSLTSKYTFASAQNQIKTNSTPLSTQQGPTDATYTGDMPASSHPENFVSTYVNHYWNGSAYQDPNQVGSVSGSFQAYGQVSGSVQLAASSASAVAQVDPNQGYNGQYQTSSAAYVDPNQAYNGQYQTSNGVYVDPNQAYNGQYQTSNVDPNQAYNGQYQTSNGAYVDPNQAYNGQYQTSNVDPNQAYFGQYQTSGASYVDPNQANLGQYQVSDGAAASYVDPNQAYLGHYQTSNGAAANYVDPNQAYVGQYQTLPLSGGPGG